MCAPENRPFAFETKSETYPVVFSVSIGPLFSGNKTASPAESYPLYSNFLRPSRTLDAASSETQPKMPHIKILDFGFVFQNDPIWIDCEISL
jgi:hypothetical protein